MKRRWSKYKFDIRNENWTACGLAAHFGQYHRGDRGEGAAKLATGYFTRGNFTHGNSTHGNSTHGYFTHGQFQHPVHFTTLCNFTALSISHLQKIKFKYTLLF
jgi:hypothetical protein